MPKFVVEETIQYIVTADSEEEAMLIIQEAADRDKYFYRLLDRKAIRILDPLTDSEELRTLGGF